MSFRREKYVPFGGPDGGNGGDGGSIYLVGDESMATLREFRYRNQFKARKGANGKGKDMTGKRGEDLEVKVPLGTQVRMKEEDGSLVQVSDVLEHGQRVLVAGGGRGGFGNAHRVSSTNQAPRIAGEGETGEEAWLVLDLKLIADVGIVGYPNSGKSTLLSAVSHAQPRVADYPFTTTEPVLGVVDIGYSSFVMADIPGIIEGAHLGRGLGLDFLRHIERTRVLIQLADGGSETLLDDLRNVEEELELYQEGLKERPRIVAVNKIDLPGVKERLQGLRDEMEGLGKPFYYISAATGEGVEELMKKALELLSQGGSPPQEKSGEEYKLFRPPAAGGLSPGKDKPRGGRRGRA